MAKTSAIQRQKKREKLVSLKWDKRQALKAKVRDLHISEEERQAAVEALNKLSKNSSPVRLRNRCVLSGRPRGYYRKFKLSRHCFRETASFGLLPGVTKASW